MDKPTAIFNIGNVRNRYEVIAVVNNTLRQAGLRRQIDKFMAEVFLDCDYDEVVAKGRKYVDLVDKGTETEEKPTAKDIEIFFDSNGESGNIFYILGMVNREMRKARRINDYNILRERVFDCHSYKDALSIIREYVDLIDIQGRD